MELILIRGAPAVGKTTITKNLLQKLKSDHNLDCAYICEDDFRKQMQYKYKSSDLQVHKNSTELIKLVLNKLLELDSYDYIFIEGQFRFKEILDSYLLLFKEHNYAYKLFHFDLGLEEMRCRDEEFRNKKSSDIQEVKKDIESFIPSESIMIDSSKSIDDAVQTILRFLDLS